MIWNGTVIRQERYGPVIDELDTPWQSFIEIIARRAQVPNEPADKGLTTGLPPCCATPVQPGAQIVDVRTSPRGSA